jgi:hypothetical protein
VYEGRYSLTNTSSKAVQIEGFTTSCGCTVAEGITGRLAPGEKRFITLKFDSHGKTGYQQYYGIVKTDNGSALVKLSGYVRSDGGYYPKAVDLGDVTRDGGKQTAAVCFLGQSVDAVRPLVSVDAPSSVSYSIEKGTNGEWNVAEDRLILQLDPSGLDPGKFSASVKVTYHRDDKQVEVTIPISGSVVDAKRASLLFAAKPVTIGEAMRREFRLRGVKKDGITGLKESSESGLTIDVVQDVDAKDASLVVSGIPVWSGRKELRVTFTDASGASKFLYDVYITVETKGK